MKTPRERPAKAVNSAAHRRPDARSIAMQVVERVLYDQAYAAAALSAEFSRYPQLSVRERAFATELAYSAAPCRESRLGRSGGAASAARSPYAP